MLLRFRTSVFFAEIALHEGFLGLIGFLLGSLFSVEHFLGFFAGN